MIADDLTKAQGNGVLLDVLTEGKWSLKEQFEVREHRRQLRERKLALESQKKIEAANTAEGAS